VKQPIGEKQLPLFADEFIKEETDPIKRKEMMMENLKFLKTKFWTKISGSSLDDIKVFDEDDYEKLKRKLRENN